MKTLSVQPNLAEQVRDAILAEIESGALKAGERVIQEQVAAALGVSRQPVQQALLLLRNQGVLREAPGRGLIVAALDPDEVEHMYAMRAVIEGLAARRAAETNAERAARQGPALIEAGRKAVASGSVPKLVAADMRFHELIYALSGNPLVAPAMAAHWSATQRVMGEVLLRDEAPRDIWDQHEAMLDAIMRGDGDEAEALARRHITQAGDYMVARLRREAAA
ncbi:GntR family transcriptional regulator [Aquabacterium humicola]|uniref:GntR family transcriptional regulator n=1 Tax=Aquabacterium humicola TaxID=3237377 RepID=UPI002542AC00|nr:GntR family transcriptional regulator [Rubrivivax pictus]